MASPSRNAPFAAILFAASLAVVGCGTASGGLHYSRGTQALEAGHTAEAITHLERAAVLVPHASEVQNHLGIAYQAAGRPADARRAYQRALDLDCDNSAAQQNLDQLEATLFPDVAPADTAAVDSGS